MLKQLYIRNFTLIDTLDIHFNPGFSVITGETGAGKSIILGAINLLLGQRADVKSIKSNSSKCVIEAHFDISRYNMQDFFTENNIDFDDTDCILRRELNSSGKTRSFINDTPVALNLMRTLGQQLIDIHSQHQNLLLNEEDFQLNVVDIIAKDRELLIKYKEHFNAYKDAKKMFKIIIKTTILPVLKIYCDKIWFMGGFVYSSIARILTKSAKVFLKSDGITPKGNITDDKVLEAGKKIYGTVEELSSKIVKGAEIALLVLGIVFTSLGGVMLLILVIFRIIWKF